jgi:hypothetical protein
MLGRTLLAACVVAVALASPAAAATDLGQTTTSPTSCGSTGMLAWQTSAPYLAPAKGVITQLRASSGTPNATLSLKVVRPSTATILFTTAPLTITAAGQVVSVDVSVPVQQGDTLGFWLGSDAIGCLVLTDPSDTIAGTLGSPDQPAGPVAGTLVSESGGRLAVAARFEADADGDGAGDDTQDSCPTDAAISSGPCVVDAGVSAAGTPASIEVGDIAVIDVSATNPGPGTVRGAALAAALPTGLASVFVTPHFCTLTAGFSCALGDFAAGSREAALVMRGTAPGSYSVPVVLTTTSIDPNAANNTAAVAIKVVAKVAQRCKVPSLKKRTKSFASALLKAAGCRLGKTKTKKVKKGRSGLVVAQSKKAGTSVPLRTRVNVTVSKRR